MILAVSTATTRGGRICLSELLISTRFTRLDWRIFYFCTWKVCHITAIGTPSKWHSIGCSLVNESLLLHMHPSMDGNCTFMYIPFLPGQPVDPNPTDSYFDPEMILCTLTRTFSFIEDISWIPTTHLLKRRHQWSSRIPTSSMCPWSDMILPE